MTGFVSSATGALPAFTAKQKILEEVAFPQGGTHNRYGPLEEVTRQEERAARKERKKAARKAAKEAAGAIAAPASATDSHVDATATISSVSHHAPNVSSKNTAAEIDASATGFKDDPTATGSSAHPRRPNRRRDADDGGRRRGLHLLFRFLPSFLRVWAWLLAVAVALGAYLMSRTSSSPRRGFIGLDCSVADRPDVLGSSKVASVLPWTLLVFYRVS